MTKSRQEQENKSDFLYRDKTLPLYRGSIDDFITVWIWFVKTNQLKCNEVKNKINMKLKKSRTSCRSHMGEQNDVIIEKLKSDFCSRKC